MRTNATARLPGLAGTPERAKTLFSCHDCGTVQRAPRTDTWATLRCWQCGAILARAASLRLEGALALSLAALVLLAIANALPVVRIDLKGHETATTLIGATRVLWAHQRALLAALVFTTAILLPLVQAAAMAYLLAALSLGRAPQAFGALSRWLHAIRPWAQSEILVLGVMVALGKLVTVAEVTPGVALYSLAAAIVLLVPVGAFFDGGAPWRTLEANRRTSSAGSRSPPLVADGSVPAGRSAMLPCWSCGSIQQDPIAGPAPCPLCGAGVRSRRSNSLPRATAFLLAAAILYLPANLLPVMRTTAMFQTQDDTIISGVLFLWNTGSWPLAGLVFLASVVVPIGKFLALGLLVVTSWRRSLWRQRERTRLYRMVEAVGRWSMLDVYVVTVLAALARAESLASIEAGPGALAFGAVVVFTMCASLSFDPQAIWDRRGPVHE